MDHARNGAWLAFAQSYNQGLFFTIEPDLPTGTLTYTLSGSYTAKDGNPGGVSLQSYLQDTDTDEILFSNRQTSYNTLNASFTLGGQVGDNHNDLSGNLSGALLPGHTYFWFYDAYIAPNNHDDSGATATGQLTLTFGDTSIPAPVPLPAASWTGLSILAGLGLWRLCRRTAPPRLPA